MSDIVDEINRLDELLTEDSDLVPYISLEAGYSLNRPRELGLPYYQFTINSRNGMNSNSGEAENLIDAMTAAIAGFNANHDTDAINAEHEAKYIEAVNSLRSIVEKWEHETSRDLGLDDAVQSLMDYGR